MRPRVLVIEDNPSTRKLLFVTLESAGYEAIEAPTGTSALQWLADRTADVVIEDLLLPDIDGFELLSRIRALPSGAAIPVLALSGYLSKLEEARVRGVGFSGYLFKPVGAAQLIETVQRYAPLPEAPADRPGRGKRVLVADDDAIERRLLALRLRQLGFEVTTAADGDEALETARREVPDAIVSNVLLPRLDGFDLCRRVREDPELADVRVVLASPANDVDPGDLRLAAMVGASALVTWRAEIGEIHDALESCLSRPPPPPPAPPVAPPDVVADQHRRRLIRHLDRQVTANRGLVQSNALRTAELAVLAGVSEVLIRSPKIDEVLDEVLARYLLSSGKFSAGAMFLLRPGGELVLRAQRGFQDTEGLEQLFGHAPLLRRVVDEQEPILIQSSSADGPSFDLLRRALARSMLITPLAHAAESFGALVTTSSDAELSEELTAFVRTVSGQVSLGVALTDALARRAASDRRYQELVDEVDAIVWEADAERTRYTFVSRQAETILGFPVEAWLDQPDFWIQHVHPSDRERAQSESRATQSGRPGWFEYRALAADGRTVWLRERARAAVDPVSGTRVFGVAFDVTDRKELEEQLYHAQKMEAVGRLASGVAHDFNNLLTIVLARCDIIARRLPKGDPLRGDVSVIRSTAERAAGITRKLLTFGRRQAFAPGAVDLNAAISELRATLLQLLGEHVRLVTALDPKLDAATIDGGQLEQILLNLVTNAKDAMPGGGVLRIETANVSVGPDLAQHHPGLRVGRYVLLTISDTGIGMDAQTRARIFEPFFTTKGAGQGTGLGLSLVFGTVEQAGGGIFVYSEPGHGSVFKIYLPSSGERAQPTEAAQPATRELRGGTETVLLVEDDDDLRELMRVALEGLGYHVLAAGHGEEALEVARRHAGRIDVMITDAIMPGMSGAELSRRLSAERPDVKVIFTSGYPESSVRSQGLAAGRSSFLPKPFTPDLMAEKVREALAGGSGRAR